MASSPPTESAVVLLLAVVVDYSSPDSDNYITCVCRFAQESFLFSADTGLAESQVHG